MSAIRAGVVGTGHMGRYHVAVYSELPDVGLVGIVDIDEERVRGLAAQYNTTPDGAQAGLPAPVPKRHQCEPGPRGHSGRGRPKRRR